MNPIKMFKDSLPALTKVLESIHGHLELQLEVQKKILEKLETYEENMNKTIEQIKKYERNAPEIEGSRQEDTENKHLAG